MSRRPRRNHSLAFKAKVAIEAAKAFRDDGPGCQGRERADGVIARRLCQAHAGEREDAAELGAAGTGRTPTGPAAALLKIVSTAPEVTLKSLHG